MVKRSTFLFFRYRFTVDNELLDETGQLGALNEVRGQYFPHGPKAEREHNHNVLLMRPDRREINGEVVLTWSMGHQPGRRNVAQYDSDEHVLREFVVDDPHIRHTDFIAIPRLNVAAADDKYGADNMGALAAISRLRSVISNIEGAAFEASFLAPGDVDNVLQALDLTEYSYTVRRSNPHPPSALARRLEAAMKAEGIGVERGVMKPMEGEQMRAAQGQIQATSDLAASGYGARGFKGTTPQGATTKIAKPPFHMERIKNLAEQAKEQRLKVVFAREDERDDLTPSVVAELVRFYGRDDAPEIPAVVP